MKCLLDCPDRSYVAGEPNSLPTNFIEEFGFDRARNGAQEEGIKSRWGQRIEGGVAGRPHRRGRLEHRVTSDSVIDCTPVRTQHVGKRNEHVCGRGANQTFEAECAKGISRAAPGDIADELAQASCGLA
ncbi:MAG: hypothetical protein EOQ70_25760 [Mesorhizobium sp.]|nr:hypothetical protein [Mesorhizobium sp.]RWA64051.1 MAG: hypothetical protein EOQ28_29985 [Mesorhizobium sp.]RWB95411.1 MAG: hypothetical protein EOQ57_29250 [Mesorhizobium sp.]RWG81095.1 MAG: hypothetical protein EOQ70_25760 [Mesorhizobium sp.]RWK15182.1 MAG: hypothetical protein EOR41_24425 [Mesorhizobium sp.]